MDKQDERLRLLEETVSGISAEQTAQALSHKEAQAQLQQQVHTVRTEVRDLSTSLGEHLQQSRQAAESAQQAQQAQLSKGLEDLKTLLLGTRERDPSKKARQEPPGPTGEL